ncbi:diguanylate cyclase (GGDEF) domain-containing protein [Oribacterium sp. WCC10]|nr:diguanylate cyclase (GGDEF) domain-containing protein [Oribacterium sp. WCC10]
MFYLDDEGRITGIGADMMRAVSEEAGYDVNFKRINEVTLKEALDNEEYDVVMPFGSAISSAAGYETIVSENLLQTPFTLVKGGDRNLSSINELKVGMLKSLGGAAETVKQIFPGMEIVFYANMDDSVKALRVGEVDALLNNSYVWSYVLQKPAYGDLSVQPSNMFSMDFRVGSLDTPKGHEIIERLNTGIAAVPDTHLQAIVLDHTSRKLYKYDFYDYLYQYRLFLIFGVMLFTALIIITTMRMRVMRLEQEEKVRQLIDRDPLTGVLSLNGFRKRVEELLREHPDVPYLISYNNIKNFKYINDSLGMTAGDDLLRFWAQKSMEVMTDEDAIGRIEGDHFVVLRKAGSDEKMLRDEIDVFEPVRNYFIEKGKGNKVQICSGVYVLTPRDHQNIDVDHMIDFARVAEKRVRDNKKEGYEFYNPEQWERGKKSAHIIAHLPVAIKDEEIQVWYQPQVNYETGKITGAEALCRWNHSRLGWLRPVEFIPALEDAGLIYDLDCYVWERVCKDLKKWKDQGKYRSVSVNLARCDISEERNISGHFYDLIKKYDLEPDQLHIEITETAYTEEPELLKKTTEKLREFGFHVEMDDFGSGYSSLSMLKEVPMDRIKLDFRFLTGAGDPEKGRIIVSNIIKMVHSLGMDIIAEGVEKITQADYLKAQGCIEMQGYYFYKPMPVSEFEELNNRIEAE